MRRKTFIGILILIVSITAGRHLPAQTATESWTRIGITYSGNITALAVSPNYELDKTLYIGVSGGGLWRSSTRGETWSQCSAIPCEATVTGIVLPGSYRYNQTMPAFAVTDEGVFYRSTDDFMGYTDVHAFSAPCTSIVSSRAPAPYAVYVSTQGSGVWMHPASGIGTGWSMITLDGSGEICRSLTITSAASQKVWGAFYDATQSARIMEYSGSGQAWTDRTPTELSGQDVRSIRASWVNSAYMWVGTAQQGMWRSTNGGAGWAAACDGTVGPDCPADVRAMRECPYSATDGELWEGRGDRLRTSNDYGANCADDFPISKINCIEFAPGFDMGSPYVYCEAFVGTDHALYKIPCAGSSQVKTPVVVDGRSVALAHDGKGFFMGSLTGGLYKCVPDRTNMVQYNNFPNGKIPQIVAICLHPSYNEEETSCGDSNTLFVAANFPDSPADNGVYASVDAANNWMKLSSGWPTSTVYMRDLAISPGYADASHPDGTLFAATSLYLYRWTGSSWVKCGEGTTPSDIYWVALTPTFNASIDVSCTNSGQSGYPCKMVWIGAKNGNPEARLYYSYTMGNGLFTEVYPSAFCSAYPGECPRDVTGIVFPADFGLTDGGGPPDPYHKIFVSSSSNGILRNTAFGWGYAGWGDPLIPDKFNTGLPASKNVVSLKADPDWAQACAGTDAVLLCAVGSNATPNNPALAGIYRATTANGVPQWTQVLSGHGLSVGFETKQGTANTRAMAGIKRDAAVDPNSLYGAFYSSDTGQNYNNFTGYYSLPDDVFSSVAHERDASYVFASSPSMGVFVSKDKGESFKPYNSGAGGTSGPCRLTNGYGITMLMNRKDQANTVDAIYVGTEEGIKAKYINCSTAGAIQLDMADDTGSPSYWLNSNWQAGGPTSGYWERIEAVPNTASTYPVWAASPSKTTAGQGFADLPAGSYDGWILQTTGLTSTDAKGVRIGYDSQNILKPVTSGQMITDSVREGYWDYYRIIVNNSNASLKVVLDDPDDAGVQNPDLYLLFDYEPTESWYDYRPYINGDETVCVTRFYDYFFSQSWGQYGDNPPSGWQITTNESPVTWNNDNWHRTGTLDYTATVTGNVARGSMNEWLVTPPFNIPNNTENGMEVRINHQFVKPFLGGGSPHGYTKIWSDQNTTPVQIDDHTSRMTSAAYKEITIPAAYKGNTNVRLAFNYVDAGPASTKSWTINSVQVGGLKTGYWYIGVRGNSSTASGYTLTATLDSGCSQTFVNPGEPNREPETGIRFAPPEPKAPMAGSTWGTVNGVGVVKGTISDTTFNYQSRGGCENAQTVMQLPDLTLICGCGDGIIYSPAPDEGTTTWLPPDAVANEGSANYVDVMQASNGDVLIAAEGTGTGSEAGGVWLSGDRGKNWMRISQGFDSGSQALSDLVADNGSPPSYYASTDGTGLWTRTVVASAYPNVTGISPTSGGDAGGTQVTITGTGFSSSCPTGTASDCPDTAVTVIFGDTEVEGTLDSPTQITCFSPAHEAGLVSVKVRNPDTRESAAGMGFTFNFTCKTPSGMDNNIAEDADPCSDTGITVEWSAPSDWGDGGSGTRTFDVFRDTTLIKTGLSEGTLSCDDNGGVNGISYNYSVRANNGCVLSYTTAGTAAMDSINVSAPTISSVTDVSACAQSGVTITWGAVSGATGYDLYVDSTTLITTVTSPYLRNPGDTSSHNYQVRAKNASCTGSWSTAVAGTDVNSAVAAPTISSVTDVSACAQSGVTITWGAVSGATGYDLYVDSTTLITTVTSPYLRNPGDTSSHSYQVRAKNASCTGLWSTVVTGTDVNNSVGTPTISSVVDADACAQSGVTITWGAVSGATGYDLYVDSTTLITTVTSPYLRNPGDTSSHSYQVRAKNASCTGSWSTVVTGTDVNNTPGAPLIGTITDSSGNCDFGIQVPFTPGTGATSHNFFVDGSLNQTDVNSPVSYTPADTGSHNYVIRAKNGACHNDSPGAAFADSNDGIQIPAAPGIIDIHPCVTDGLTITWDPVAGATGYDLRVDGSTTYTDVTSPYLYLPGDNDSHNFKVRAKNTSCTTAWSAVTAGSDLNGTPSAPSIISVVDNNPAVLDGVIITFTAGSPATVHHLYMDELLVSSNFVSGSVYVPGDGNTHSFKVTAVNGTCSKDSAESAGQDLLVSVPPETAPGTSYETAQTWSEDKATQYWPVNGTATGYKLYRIRKSELDNLQTSTDEGCMMDVGASTNHDCSGDDPSGLPNRIYYYLVTGYNIAGEGTAGEATGFSRDLSSSQSCS